MGFLVMSVACAVIGPSPSKLVIVVCSAQVLVQIGAFFWPALLPAMMPLWNLSNSEAGWITASFYGAYMMSVPVLVTLTDRVDPPTATPPSNRPVRTGELTHVLRGGVARHLLDRGWRLARGTCVRSLALPGGWGQPLVDWIIAFHQDLYTFRDRIRAHELAMAEAQEGSGPYACYEPT